MPPAAEAAIARLSRRRPSGRAREPINSDQLDRERAVLGAIFLENGALDGLRLKPEEFYDPKHRTIYAAMRELRAGGKPIDPFTVLAELERGDRLGLGLDRAYLTGLLNVVPTADNVEFYADLVAADVARRADVVHRAEIAEAALRGAEPAELAALVEALVAPPQPSADSTPMVRAVDLVDRIRAASKAPRVATPFPQLDAALGGGLRARTITAFVSGVGAGKSSLALSLGAHHSRSAPVVYLGLEIAIEQLGARVVGQILGRSWHDVLDGQVSDADMRRALEPLDLAFLPRCADPLSAILCALDTLRPRMRPGQVAMLIVDYVQLLADLAAAGGDFRIATHEAVRQLRELVEASPDLVCILVSQSSRGGAKQLREGADNAADLIGTGAESSAIEQASANLINLSFTPKDGATSHEVTANISKARLGARGKVGLLFDGPTGRWQELDRPPAVPADLELAEQIIASVRAGNGALLSKNQILSREGHRVTGSRTRALALISRLASEGAFEEQNGAFRWR